MIEERDSSSHCLHAALEIWSKTAVAATTTSDLADKVLDTLLQSPPGWLLLPSYACEHPRDLLF